MQGRDRDSQDGQRLGQRDAAQVDRIDAGDALRPVGDVDRCVQVVHENTHDFPETERDDGQVIATQAQGRRAE